MTRRRAVTIVGAGTAGLTCALILARRGIDVFVVDAAARIERSVCGEYLCPAGVSTLEELDVMPLVEGAPPVLGMRLVSPAGRVVRSHFPRDGRHGVGLSLDKQAFLERLADAVVEAGGRIRFGWRVDSIQRLDDGWRVGAGRKRTPIECDVLIGADGRRSVVADAAGLLAEAGDRTRIAVRGFVNAFDDPERLGEMHLLPGGAYIGVNPIRRDEVNLTLVCDAEELRRRGGAEGALRQYAHDARDLYERHDWSTLRAIRGVTPVSSRVKRAVADRVALIGDASGFVDPLTGEGISIALWSGLAAAESVVSGLAPGADLVACLHRYGVERRAKYRAKAAVSRSFQWVIRRGWACEWIGHFLGARQERADAFIGIIGNNYTPSEGALALAGVKPAIP